MSLPQIDDFRQLFLSNTRMLDVRAPVEYEQGAFPNTINIPLLNDDERHQVGLCYKTRGQDKAIELGYELVSGNVKSERVDRWAGFFQQHPQAVLYCFRGGMRSKITQQWIYEQTGIAVPRVKGGYKALRQFLLQQLEHAADNFEFLILSGRTGSGKTLLLERMTNRIDLEKIYYHRGSAFGSHVDPQPCQINIENTLAIELLNFEQKGITRLVLEDESACIGARRIPENIVKKMQQAPVMVLQADDEQRINIIFDEYITQSLDEHVQKYGPDTGFEKWADALNTSMDKIQRRLGGKAHSELKAILQAAIVQQKSQNSAEKHKEWIARLLFDYYDPMYDYQLEKKRQRVVFSGNATDILDFVQ